MCVCVCGRGGGVQQDPPAHQAGPLQSECLFLCLCLGLFPLADVVFVCVCACVCVCMGGNGLCVCVCVEGVDEFNKIHPRVWQALYKVIECLFCLFLGLFPLVDGVCVYVERGFMWG